MTNTIGFAANVESLSWEVGKPHLNCRTLHSFQKHLLCCVRGVAAGGDESDFGEDGDVDSCHHRSQPCMCMYDNSVHAKWSTSPWKADSKNSCADKHDSNENGNTRVPSQTRIMKLKQLQQDRKRNEQQGRAFHQDQTVLLNQVRDLQQELVAKERDYALPNKMVQDLEQRLGSVDIVLNEAKVKVAQLMEKIDAVIPSNFDDQTLLEQLENFEMELEMVIVPENDENFNNTRRISVHFPSRIKNSKRVLTD